MCDRTINTRYDGRVDKRPPADILRSIGVRGHNKPAGLTDELSLALAVGLFAMPALRARAARVAWVNRYCCNSGELGFVLDKSAKLSKGPLAMSRTLRPSNRGPLADALQVFETYSSVAFCGFRYEPLRDYVVGVALEAPLFARELLKVALGRFRTRSLELGADTFVALARLLNLLRGVCVTIGVSNDVDHSEVNTYPVLRCSRWGFLDIDRGEQIPLPTAINEIGLTLPVGKHLTSPLTTGKRDALAPGHGPDRYGIVGPPEDTVVVSDSAKGLELPLPSLIELVSISDLGDGAYHHLRGQAGGFTHGVVREFMDTVLPKAAMLPAYLANFIGRSVGRPKRFLERAGLLSSRKQLYLYGQSHTRIIPRNSQVWINDGARSFLRHPREAVSMTVVSL